MNEDVQESAENRSAVSSGKGITTMNTDTIIFRKPDARDGKHIWQLVKNTGVLDLNSVYCYLLLCDHFRETCGVAEMNGNIVGFVTAYILPDDETTLFVWQVGTDDAVRGRGIASKLIMELLERDCCANVSRLQCTISPSNKASLGLFNSLAKHLHADFSRQDYYGTSLFPVNGHEQEDLIVVGPIK